MDQIILNSLKTIALKYNIDINDSQLKNFGIYADFLKNYNQKVNLTAITKDSEIIEKHFLDSIIVTKYISINNTKIIDVGSGAGFPGVPLNIINNSINLTLIDSIGKKVKFLELLKEQLNLNYFAIHARAEELGKKTNYREKYNFAIARAVKNLCELSEYCLPLVSIGGYFISMKGTNIDQELKDAEKTIKILGGKITDIFKYKLPSGDNRSIILIKKISQTPPIYPRSSAKIAKKIIQKKDNTNKLA